MTPPLLCAGLEVALNRYLRLEPSVLAECERWSGRSIELRVLGWGWSFVIEFIATGVRVLPQAEQPADVTVSGPFSTLMRLALKSAGGAEGGMPNGLDIEGDAELLQRFNRLLARVGFDPEELAAKLVGDTAAHRVTQGLKELFGWGRKTVDTLSLDTAEYLREETRDLARGLDVEDWMNEIDRLRERTDRFEARLALIEQRSGARA